MTAVLGGVCYCKPGTDGPVICQDALGRYNPTACRYTCAGCKRRVPWCYGADDDYPELCDDCWLQARAADGGGS